MGTTGSGDIRILGLGDVGTQGPGNVGMWGHGDTGAAAGGSRGAVLGGNGEHHPVHLRAEITPHPGRSTAMPGRGCFRAVGKGTSARQTAAGPALYWVPGEAMLSPPTTHGRAPACRAPRQQGDPGCWHSMAQLGTPWLKQANAGQRLPGGRSPCHRVPLSPKRSREKRVCPLGAVRWDGAGTRPRRWGTRMRRRSSSSDGGARKRRPVAEVRGGAAEAQPLLGPNRARWGDPRVLGQCMCGVVVVNPPPMEAPAAPPGVWQDSSQDRAAARTSSWSPLPTYGDSQ